jgi:hypothetical protein
MPTKKDTGVEEAAAKAAAAKEAKAAAEGAKGPKVAPGISVTSKRKLLSEGTVVTEKDFVGGKADIEALLKSGKYGTARPSTTRPGVHD